MKYQSALTVAPLRVSFVGGGSDIATFYSKHPGAVVSAAINKYVYVHVKRHDPLFQERYRISYSTIEHCQSRNEIQNEIVRSCLELLNLDEPLQINTSADLPSNSGLGSSSSFAVALLLALHTLMGENVGPAQLAEEAYAVEYKLLKSPVGKQDHYAAAFGGLNKFVFNPDESVEISPLYVGHEELGRLLDNVILIWTGDSRSANKILQNQAARAEENFTNLKILTSQAEKFSKLLLEKKLNLEEIGSQIKDAWQVKLELSPLIITPRIQEIIDEVLPFEPYGYKLLGAGGGGFVLALINSNQLTNLLKNVRFPAFQPKLDHAGARVITSF
jgi:D-glycero-alpha-D-manno-heptose-7-phosphate kinase